MTRYAYNPLAITHRKATAAAMPGISRIITPEEYQEFLTDCLLSREPIIAPHIPDDEVLADYARLRATILPNISFYLPPTSRPTLRNILKESMKKSGIHFSASTDKMNRKPLPSSMQTPHTPIDFPTSSASAIIALHEFVDHRMVHFGDYEDAISTTDNLLYHANISSSLNIGLLSCDDILDAIRRAIAKGIPHNSVEAFFRQIFGWREYMHSIWWNGPRDASGEFLGSWQEFMASSLKRHYTDKRPFRSVSIDESPPIVASSIRDALSVGYAHHIVRLMIIGNYLYLIAADPVDCVNIFLSMTVDAYPWVMYGNVVYMSRFIFGRVYTHKAYYSSSKYISRMLSEPLDEKSTAIFDELYAIAAALGSKR